MPTGAATPAAQVIMHWTDLALRLGLAFAAGLIVTVIYRFTRPRWEVNPTFPPTLVLLAILIAAVSQVVGNNVALAFSLVGALSIVRFRTVVRDTQDTAFVIFAVVIGMAAGTGSYMVASGGLIIGGIAAITMAQWKAKTLPIDEHSITLRIGLGQDASTLLAPAFSKHVEYSRVESILTSKQGAALDYTYRVRLNPGSKPADIVKDLNRIEGVQNVELRRVTDEF
jgi:hypothetical protein